MKLHPGRGLFASIFALVSASFAGAAEPAPLVIVDAGKTQAVIVVSPQAGEWERKAADDLAGYIERMSGAKPAIAAEAAAITQALNGAGPVLVIGQEALKLDPTLAGELAKVAKKNPILRSDAIVLRRTGNRVLLAGNNDDAHYYAVSELLHRWGCRWYMPTEFGECIPEQGTLKIDWTNYVYAPPFEIRKYWISWVGDYTGSKEFQARNFMNHVVVPSGHALGQYVKDLIPAGKTMFNVPITPDATADHVAKQVEAQFGEGKHVMLGMEDGLYESDNPLDVELNKLQFDKYFMTPSMTDAFIIFYNKVAERLEAKHPGSPAKIGFLAYGNLTLPPLKTTKTAKSLVAYLAPIDIDPIHGMDDPRFAPKHEYKDMLYKWAKIMDGRLAIYDYDQGMLVWRDIPNPSHQAFRQDVQHYAKAGILGIDTESRNAIGTTFTNLHFRGQLMWKPEFDVDAGLAEFYPKFYGPAAEPMARYWGKIYKSWEETISTEHEYFLVPLVYPQALVADLEKDLAAAEQSVAAIRAKGTPTRNEKLYSDRIAFTRLSYDILKAYTDMAKAAATDADFAAAIAAGQHGLAAREKMTAMNGTFTTYKTIGENGPAWWPGEVDTYKEYAALVDGTKGTLVAKLPLVWAFRRDEGKVGLKEGWAKAPVDLAWWKSQPAEERSTIAGRQKNPGAWEEVSTDLYLQAQGLVTKEKQSWTGDGWYRLDLDLKPDQVAGPVHLFFPGIFNECWLYVNGQEVAHRPQNVMWWYNDYKFAWDIDLAGKLQPGQNTIAVRINNPHHFGGMFRRPLLYRAK